jgi:hypothetical protein
VNMGRRDGPHELEFTVGWNEGDCSITVELAELDALVELTVVQLYRARLDCTSGLALVAVGCDVRILVEWRRGEGTNDLSRTSLSFRPNLHSGVPLR